MKNIETHIKNRRTYKVKIYDDRNKERVKERRKANEPYICSCGVSIRKEHITTHCKTKRHIKRLGLLEQ